MPVTLALADRFGVFDRREFRKLPHALRSARDRASAWGRTIFIFGELKVWTVTPDRNVTVKRRQGDRRREDEKDPRGEAS